MGSQALISCRPARTAAPGNCSEPPPGVAGTIFVGFDSSPRDNPWGTPGDCDIRDAEDDGVTAESEDASEDSDAVRLWRGVGPLICDEFRA